MPSLSDTIRRASGTRINSTEEQQAQPNKPDITSQPSQLQWTRSPVPPISISPDSVNMFQNSGLVPQDRIMSVLPLFTDTSTEAGSSTTTNVISTGSGGSSSGGTSGGGGTTPVTPTVPKALSTAFVTPVISQGIPYQSSFQIARSFVLLSVAVSSPARVEFYSTANARISDGARNAAQPITLGAPNGLIADMNLIQPTELNWTMSPAAVGNNGDFPTSATIYVTVTNQNPSSQPITISIVYFPLEA